MLVRKGYEEQNVLYESTSKVALSRRNYERKLLLMANFFPLESSNQKSFKVHKFSSQMDHHILKWLSIILWDKTTTTTTSCMQRFKQIGWELGGVHPTSIGVLCSCSLLGNKANNN
jgi:hypothetical protein